MENADLVIGGQEYIRDPGILLLLLLLSLVLLSVSNPQG